ncbi:contractile injection system tape measure protein [Porphyromonas endodontalis]|uniref:contractile injection system tape measure protein n=1 Tax=Porphyromonas endodontalis TaxID=28124 RepID=UPI0028EAADE3|nr:contractile injection system tape measure protein [Porphyromonas endodontalis]
MSSNLIHKAIFDVTIDTSEKEGNAVSNMLFERNVRPALEEVLQQFENDDMIIEHSIELNIGTITEGELEHSIAEKLRQALLKYRHDGGVLSNYNHFIELKTDMLLDYIQKPVVPWSIDRVKGFDLQQLLRESIQKAMKSEVYLEQMTTLLSDSIEACKRFFELPFQQTDFYILLERLVSKSPIFRGRISSDVIKLFREEREFDFLLSKEIMHYLLSCSLFGSKQENILSLMIVRLLRDRWHSKKSMKSRKPIKETIVSSSKMILAQDLQDRNYAYPLPITASASDAQDGAPIQSYVATGLPDTIPAPSSIAAYIPNHQSETSLPSSSVADFLDTVPITASTSDAQDGALVQSYVATGLPDTIPAPSSIAAYIPNHQSETSLPSSSVADFLDTVPITASTSDAQDGALVQSYVATGLPDTIPAPSPVDTNISNHQNGRTLPSSSVADFPDTVPIPSSINDDAKEQGKGASSDFYKLNTESIASSDIALGLSWTLGDRGELHETNSNPRNTNSSQLATKSDGLIKKLQQLIRNINRIAEEREHFSDVITDIEQIIKEIQSDEQWKLLLGSNESSAYALQKELLRLKNQTKEDPKQAKELSEGDNITEEDALQIAKAIESLRKVETIEEQERPEKGIRELTAVIMRTQPDLKERIPIYNAGLVLFQPFLISFFDRLGLLESRKHFKSATCQIRAAHLLHELSGFGEIPVEHLMLFNKLLCGINIMFPIDCRFKISETESLEMEHLLRATIGNWAIIRNTSISGFQESFVKRQGVLERSQDDWILRVETKGIDILLDDIPWDIHLISFPWNNYLVYVDWHL